MAHHEVLFPQFEGWQHEGGPGYQTDVITMDSRQDRRVQRSQNPERSYLVRFDANSPEQVRQVLDFYVARGGLANSFNYFDPRDHHSAATAGQIKFADDVVLPSDQNIGVGDGTTTTFQLVKRYQDGGGSHVRSIRKPISGTIRVAVDGVEKTIGVDFTVNVTTGVVTFMSAPSAAAVITAGFKFYVPVFFGEAVDQALRARLSSPDMASTVTVPLMEALYPASPLEDFWLGGAKTLDNTSSGGPLLDYSARLWRLWPVTSKVLLPDLSLAPEGGPIFLIDYPGVGTPPIKTHDDATLIHTLSAGQKVEIWCGRDFVNAKTWIVFA